LWLGFALTASAGAEPLVVGETFSLPSAALKEQRRINVYLPAAYDGKTPLPVLYMPDGGVAEDFPHIMGLVQVLSGNGAMRPFVLVGIENTERRRDLTGPTDDPEDKKVAPRVGGSAAFRAFLRNELKPEIAKRYRVTDESAIVGESAAGLFVVETLLLEPDLFDTYIAVDPSLWWNGQDLTKRAADLFARLPKAKKALFLAGSDAQGNADVVKAFADELRKSAPSRLRWHYEPMPGETHMTIFHPAALKAFRKMFKPDAR
jgi:hypothetical protein